MLDTHAVARSLTDAEFTEAQADAITNAVRLAAEHGDHVTSDQFKVGLAEVRTEIAALDTRLSTQIAGLDARLSSQIANLETRLLRWRRHRRRARCRVRDTTILALSGHGRDPGTDGGARPILPAPMRYYACIYSMQYTIRAVPDEIDRAIRQRAKRESKSLNAVVIDALARGLALDAATTRHTDLDHLVGTWQEDPDFDSAVAEFERIDDESWK